MPLYDPWPSTGLTSGELPGLTEMDPNREFIHGKYERRMEWLRRMEEQKRR